MNIHYYDDHPEEFENITQAIRSYMKEIWGDHLKNTGQSPDDQDAYAELFEELQYIFTPESFSELQPAQTLDRDRMRQGSTCAGLTPPPLNTSVPAASLTTSIISP